MHKKITFLSLLLFSLLLFAAPTLAKENRKPNVIILIADQLRAQSVGYAGDELAITPNLDKLAKESVDLTQCVANTPVCSAFRASFWTGKYTTSHGMVINELRINPNQRCLGHVFTDGGYQTGYVGKWHLYANQLGNHNDPKNSFTPRGKHRLGFDGYWAGYGFHHGYYGKNAYYHTESEEKITFEPGTYEPDGQTDLAMDYIKKVKDDKKPFCLVVAYGTPHDPWAVNNVPKEDYAKFKDVDFPLPKNFHTKKDPYGDSWSNGWLGGKGTDEKRKEKLLLHKRVYYAMTTNLDTNVGRLVQFLKKNDLEENTILLFTSDHGEMFGAQGRMKKNIFFDESARIPCLLRWKGKLKPAKVDIPFSTIDFFPTLAGFANLKAPASAEGTDCSQFLLTGKGDAPKYALLQNTGACAAWSNGHEWRAVRTKDFTYAVFRDPRKELLFQNNTDPFQTKNLANNCKFAATKKEYVAWLKKEMKKIKDDFSPSLYYRDNWTKDRMIIKSATSNFEEK